MCVFSCTCYTDYQNTYSMSFSLKLHRPVWGLGVGFRSGLRLELRLACGAGEGIMPMKALTKIEVCVCVCMCVCVWNKWLQCMLNAQTHCNHTRGQQTGNLWLGSTTEDPDEAVPLLDPFLFIIHSARGDRDPASLLRETPAPRKLSWAKEMPFRGAEWTRTAYYDVISYNYKCG